MKRYSTLTGLALVLVLAGCGAGPETGHGSGHDSGQAQPGASSSATVSAGLPNAADVEFAAGMIPHHEQAVEMSDSMLTKTGIDPEVTALATRIKAAQAPEIRTMKAWLETWGKPDAGGGSRAGHSSGHGGEAAGGGGGMMSGEQLEELAGAEGAEASRLFLAGMIEHHKGAIDMAEQELDAGADPGAKDLAASIVQAQEAEIKEMEALLAGL
ncbi:DUF305 domain-containing protein [Arthrobacter crusticola]|uniref:DUF305 domain-containing protein n=1 Tax=Arthrobacter crusticola TaxID=2547960 RepID=A0A4R5TZT0_9MICC|nr:DUF305 domain-containing protein [Arthrobacter crusticola]TDK26768.1 DUF305 domain-containing protein [Arthrobacter crusticola]